jgi:hypothetical protein
MTWGAVSTNVGLEDRLRVLFHQLSFWLIPLDRNANLSLAGEGWRVARGE